MKELKSRGLRWQAGVDSRNALDDELLELAADSGCYMLSVGFESISRQTLKNVHKYQNDPATFHALVKKIQSYGIMVFGLFIFGFDHDDLTVFDETVKFNIDSGFDVCAYSLLTPYPGTLAWYEMIKKKRIISYDWNKYDQGHIVFKPASLSPGQITEGYNRAYRQFYSIPSMLKRFPVTGSRNRLYWSAYNILFRKGKQFANAADMVAAPTANPLHLAKPPIMPERKDWKKLVLENTGY